MPVLDEVAPAVPVVGSHAKLATKIAAISASVVGRVKKDGHNAFHHYDYATESAIIEAVRDAQVLHRVAIVPSVLAASIAVQPIGDKGELLTTLVVGFTIIDGESGEEIYAQYPGAGTDKADKGIYKAVTGATKYFLQKLYQIPTGDDPEKTDKADRPAPRRPPPDLRHQDSPQTAPQTAQDAPGVTTVQSVTRKSGTTKNRPWVKCTVLFDDGREGVTFDTGLADALDEASQSTPKRRVCPDLQPDAKGKGFKVAGLLELPAAPEPVHGPDEPVDGYEKVLTVRPTASGTAWIIQTDKRELVTNDEDVSLNAGAARLNGRGVLPFFDVVPSPSNPRKRVNVLTKLLVEPEAREPGSDDE